jgi:hypothetical protein
MVWMYIDAAAMQQYAVLRPGGDGICPSVVQSGHKWAIINTRCFLLPLRVG